MKPVKEKIQYDNRNVVWKRVQNEMWFEVWSQVSRGMSRTVDMIWIRTSRHAQDKVQ